MFAVVWHNFVLDELADIYVAANSMERAVIAAGVAGLNSQLAADPFDIGESRGGILRVAFPPLLTVFYEVHQADRIVRVGHVRRPL